MSEHLDKAEEKQALRSRFLRDRQLLAPAEQQSKSARIRDDFLAWLETHPISPDHVIALYSAIQGEVDLFPLVESLAERNLKAALPRTKHANRQMTFHLVQPRDTLVRGSFGILQPSADSPLVKADEVGVFLVPGIAYTPSGVRLGYGGGYYDRWFAGPARDSVRIGVAYQAQILPELPLERHDQLMHYILTEEGVQSCQ